jgi:hypothetical protein
MSEMLNPVAETNQPDSGEIVVPTVNLHKKRKEVKFFCPDHDCKDPERKMIIKKSSKGNYFFSHKSGCEHEIRPETLLHKLAISWFKNKTEFEVPEEKSGSTIIEQQVLTLNPDKTELEFKGIDTIRPDVLVETTNGLKIAIEIYVTHKIDDEKKIKLQETNTPTIEIDLSEFYENNKEECRVNKSFNDENLDDLLTKITLKKWIIPPDEAVGKGKLKTKQASDNTGCFVIAASIGLILLIRRLFR